MSLVTVLNMSSAKPRVTLVRGCCAKDASERHAIHETQMRQIAAARLEDKFVFIWLVRATAIVHKREGTTESDPAINKYFTRCYLPGKHSLLRHRREQIRMQQRLELLIIGLKVHLQI